MTEKESVLFALAIAAGFIFVVVFYVKLLCHTKTGYEKHIFSNDWIFKPEIFDEEGKKLRKKAIKLNIVVVVLIVVVWVYKQSF